MMELLARAEAGHWPLVALLGDPGFYGRFGFEPSSMFDIHYPPAGADSPNFLIRRLPSFDPSLSGEVAYCWERPAG
jgi:putative acetyltransferase